MRVPEMSLPITVPAVHCKRKELKMGKLKVLLAALTLVLAVAGLHAQGTEPTLVGTWKLVAFEGEFKDTGEKIYDWGKNPRGYVIFSADGHYVALIEAEGRKAPQTDQDRANLWKSMFAYAGKYRMDPDKHINFIEVAYNPAIVGTQQIRFQRFEGNRLIVTTDWAPAPRDPTRLSRGHIIWERVN
jgi:hypothetical protein